MISNTPTLLLIFAVFAFLGACIMVGVAILTPGEHPAIFLCALFIFTLCIITTSWSIRALRKHGPPHR
jgi:uncharacterized membrane protein YesL